MLTPRVSAYPTDGPYGCQANLASRNVLYFTKLCPYTPVPGNHPCPGASGRSRAGPEGKRGTDDHGKRSGASTPSRITSSNVETTARANTSTAIPPISR